MKSTEQIYISLCIAANPSKEMFHNPVKRCARQEKNCKTFRKQTSLLMTRRRSWINLLIHFCLFQHCRFTSASFIWAKIAFSLSHHIQSNNTSLNLSQVDLLFRTKLLYLFIVLLIFQNCYCILFCARPCFLFQILSHTTTNILSPFICQFWVCIIRAPLIWIPNCTIKTSHCYVKLFRWDVKMLCQTLKSDTSSECVKTPLHLFYSYQHDLQFLLSAELIKLRLLID